MTGKEVLEAMSFVDEAYIEEAETETIHNVKFPVMKVLLPLAACFCLVFLGLQTRTSTETAPMDAVMEQEAISETVNNSLTAEAGEAVDPPTAAEIPTLILRIEQWEGEGFAASIAADSDLYQQGTVVNVQLQNSICIETVANGLVTVERRMPTEADFPAGSLIRVRYVIVSEKENTIRIESICKED